MVAVDCLGRRRGVDDAAQRRHLLEEEEEEVLFAFNDTMDDIAQGRHLYVHTCMHLCMGRA